MVSVVVPVFNEVESVPRLHEWLAGMSAQAARLGVGVHFCG
ncbi:MAG: hypothetical protein ACREYC_16705 [Gammaproteobacteria bacterium]